MELVDFLRARYDEDEKAAREATPGPWAADEPLMADWVKSGILGYVADCSIGAGYRAQSIPDAAHIARHNPARVLAEVEAKRELIDEVLGYEARIDGEWGVGEGVSPNTVPALRLLARPFREHSDFDPAWLED